MARYRNCSLIDHWSSVHKKAFKELVFDKIELHRFMSDILKDLYQKQSLMKCMPTVQSDHRVS